MLKSFPFYKQFDSMDCGPACLRMISKYYGKHYSLNTLRSKSSIIKEGVSLKGISQAAEDIGFKTLGVQVTIDEIKNELTLPVIAHWNQNHFVIIYKIKGNNVFVADPAKDLMVYSKTEFLASWASFEHDGQKSGIVLTLEPTPAFLNNDGERNVSLNLKLLFSYLSNYKRLIIQLFVGLFLGSLLQLIFPFLTQSIVDIGINNRDQSFLLLILIAQLTLYVGQTTVDFLRSWILLHINTRLNVAISTDFLIKLMRLPISFFDNRKTGDIIQRVDDQQRIQNFLTGPALDILFSIVNFFVFTFVIIAYSVKILTIFLAGSVIYIAWLAIFLRHRKKLDYKRFDILSENQSNLIQLIHGMQEIKMTSSETAKRWQWERIQAKVFKVNIKSLSLSQYQQGGAIFINQTKNVIITFYSATAVIHGEMSLGAMLAIQYIIGQLSSPIEQFIQFIQLCQDALISIARLNEIHSLEDEEPNGVIKSDIISRESDLILKNVNFSYTENCENYVLKDLNLTISRGHTTAIVGVSGSGKTSLLKLLMKFYLPTEGDIFIGDDNLKEIRNSVWRTSCGSVLQDSYIFPDTIANNIAVGEESPCVDDILKAVQIANLTEFIGSLPIGLNTMIGENGSGISQGQKQRLLIARVAYKNPQFIFFDEATNSLDANNEKVIMENLNSFFYGKTLIIAAHRLSTIRNASQIIVMDGGTITEKGTHESLINNKGIYYSLVQNQMEAIS